MVIKSTLGYALGILGIIGVAAWAIPQFKSAIPQMSAVNDTILLIASTALAALGIFLIAKSGGGFGRRRKVHEVPIYQGKEIVGYRREK